jgi:hypothetical protein
VNALLRSAFLAALVSAIAACTLFGGQKSAWQPYSFNGKEFIAGDIMGMPTLWVRNGYAPQTESSSRSGSALATAYGAVAGFCYLQVSGGKLAEGGGTLPLNDERITIYSEKLDNIVSRSDSAGFFSTSLPPGDYEIGCRGQRKPFRIRNGETTLIPLQCGKRMVD